MGGSKRLSNTLFIHYTIQAGPADYCSDLVRRMQISSTIDLPELSWVRQRVHVLARGTEAII